MRFQLAHDKPATFYMTDDRITNRHKEQDMALFIDKIQAEKSGLVGWFGGLTTRCSTDDLEDALKQHPLLQRHAITNVELRQQVVRIRPGKLRDEEPSVKALHIYTAHEHVPKLRRILNQIYPSKAQDNYPLGKHLHFAPNTADVRFPNLMHSVTMADKLRAKQKTFLSAMTAVQTTTIKNLHKVIPTEPQTSLMHVLMSWRSAEDPDRLLFTSIDTFRGEIFFTFNTKMSAEAYNLIPLLSLVLVHKYGKEAEAWFTADAQEYTVGFAIDPTTGHIISTEEAHLEDTVDDWEFECDDNDLAEQENTESTVIVFGDIIINGTTPSYNELGDKSVGTFHHQAGVNQKKRNETDSDDSEDDSEEELQSALKTIETQTDDTIPTSTLTGTPTPAPNISDAVQFLLEQQETPDGLKEALKRLAIEHATPNKEDGGVQ